MKEPNTQGKQCTGQRDNSGCCVSREDVGHSRGVAAFILKHDS